MAESITCTELVTTTQNTSPVLPALQTVRVGKSTKQVQYFTSTLGAKELKVQLAKANPTLSKKEIANRVNSALRGEIQVREVLGIAAVQMAFSRGYTPDRLDLGKGTGALRLVKIKPEAAPVVPVVPKTPAETMAQLKAGMNAEQWAAFIKAQLAPAA